MLDFNGTSGQRRFFRGKDYFQRFHAFITAAIGLLFAFDGATELAARVQPPAARGIGWRRRQFKGNPALRVDEVRHKRPVGKQANLQRAVGAVQNRVIGFHALYRPRCRNGVVQYRKSG